MLDQGAGGVPRGRRGLIRMSRVRRWAARGRLPKRIALLAGLLVAAFGPPTPCSTYWSNISQAIALESYRAIPFLSNIQSPSSVEPGKGT
jgi:hypothetical protein